MRKITILAVALLLFAGCTSKVSKSVPRDGIMSYEEVSFPDASKKEGIFVNAKNLSLVKPGMTKDQITHLIGSPHFKEGFFYVVEWDYLFNFGSIQNPKKCQFKVIFDEDMIAKSLFFKPKDCSEYASGGELQIKKFVIGE